ncbi:hypothetical protein [Blastococcus deserti]|uniref:Uncharacterized protein n=1 Tax=Blastococcus deserti TaxID=2259033 RepID=A0ABW4X6B5_9ACTN
MAPEVVAGIITGGAGLAGVLITACIKSRAGRTEDAGRDERMLQEAIRELLNGRWELRTLQTIKKHVALDDEDELRQALRRAGAVRFYRERGTSRETELWGLRQRNLERLRGRAQEDIGA